jgi:excisionase family DNA binding protein
MSAVLNSQDRVVSIVEAAERLGISKYTLRRRARAGAIKILRLSSRRIGVRLSELDRFMTAAESGSDAKSA